MAAETHYEKSVLQQLLQEALPEREENLVSEHLEACQTCRQEFEILAATNEWWIEAAKRLSRSAERRQNDVVSSSSRYDDDDDSQFSTDFAVDFLEPSDNIRALGRLGEYEIEEIIGRGGMGIVLKGFQKELHRHVAVKVLSPHLATSGAARRRFAREAQATAAVVHPHVMAIHSVNAQAKLPYLVMPFVACQSLQQRLDRQGPLAVADILRIGMQTAQGLSAAHSQGLVHRDVKPANILLEDNVDRVLLTDFGLARAVDDATLTRTGIIAGTPQYMSPEQANGDIVEHRSDLFSLGAVLYAMCTGRPPFRAETTFGVLRRIRETVPRSVREINSEIPEWLERIVLKLLAKDQVDRFATAQDVAVLLEQCLAHVQQPMSVALPTVVGDWALVPTQAAEGCGRQTIWRRVRLIAVIVVIALSAGLLTNWFRSPQESVATQRGLASSEANASDTQTSTTANEAPAWNEVDQELDEISEQVEALDLRMGDHSGIQ
ncbi:serine/threonine-protein kinase [Schlesneria paludicola]|uniref:serine/threonine-protein kinase n=1 Tax=Schlesneria paludicola TaxID=360056 RepID=UPI00029A6F0A|nr:serine/threonine-protein kinase [Schlesneria paludicola]